VGCGGAEAGFEGVDCCCAQGEGCDAEFRHCFCTVFNMAWLLGEDLDEMWNLEGALRGMNRATRNGVLG
jgi:hypothetical protein